MDRIIQVLNVMAADIVTIIRLLCFLNTIYSQPDVDTMFVELVLLELDGMCVNIILTLMQ